MSIFASCTQQTIPIPFDPPQTVTIRALTGREMDAAQAEHLKALVSGQTTRGWAALFKRRVSEGVVQTDADVQQELRDPLLGFDVYTIVAAGVVGWTYNTPVTPEALADLVYAAVDFFARQIMRLTQPSLFQTAEDAERAEKND